MFFHLIKTVQRNQLQCVLNSTNAFIFFFILFLENQVYVPLICRVKSSLEKKKIISACRSVSASINNSKFLPHCSLINSESRTGLRVSKQPVESGYKNKMGVISVLRIMELIILLLRKNFRIKESANMKCQTVSKHHIINI